jgi:hypothetical protein
MAIFGCVALRPMCRNVGIQSMRLDGVSVLPDLTGAIYFNWSYLYSRSAVTKLRHHHSNGRLFESWNQASRKGLIEKCPCIIPETCLNCLKQVV